MFSGALKLFLAKMYVMLEGPLCLCDHRVYFSRGGEFIGCEASVLIGVLLGHIIL